MRLSALATVALVGMVFATSKPSSTANLAPKDGPPPSCQTNFDGNFGITVVALGTQSLHAGVIYTSGFSVCTNGSLALGGSTTFYRCLSGNFWNLYDRNVAEQCSPIHLAILPCGQKAPAPAPADGQVVGSVTVATAFVTVMTDGKPQVVATKVPLPVCQIGDGQIQAHTTLCGKPPPATQSASRPNATQPAMTPPVAPPAQTTPRYATPPNSTAPIKPPGTAPGRPAATKPGGSANPVAPPVAAGQNLAPASLLALVITIFAALYIV
ncbi:cell wall mannoprotein CIS3 [Colletotrichum spaethianum]|uniref:Cell wall mannoprotein CIS3 n=1 Tax=Colletotrichum spaethianum TaxID=700344 RepID=A0AA37LIN0_9PEZI|nr:cell wall mannoprotein CIS3 [Colletotrichum spaethianum]GKT44757.1 cell wall mannoprotein CIS3 [Colletotrichum spaethianum]